jgi:hypothetical protein
LATGASIKTINDQEDYSLWEFYYDPSKDTSAVAATSGMNAMNGTPQSAGAINLNGNSNSSSNNSAASATSTNPAQNPNPVPAQPQ